MQTQKRILLFALPIVVSFILHFPIFKLDVIGYHAWRQTQTQTVIYHFNHSHPSLFHPQKFDVSNGTTKLLYEFPIYQWLISKYNQCCGYSVMHTRLMTFMIFCFFLLGFFKLLKRHVNDALALATHTAVCFSPLLYYYCVNPLPDTMALMLGTWSLYYFHVHFKTNSIKYILLSATLLSLATLVKLPYILFGAPVIFLLFKKIHYNQLTVFFTYRLIYIFLLAFPFLWYMHAMPTWTGNGITQGIVSNQKSLATLIDYLLFHFISSLPELLTNYASTLFLIFGAVYCFKYFKTLIKKHLDYFTIFIALVLYFLFEINMIEKTHDYYLMPFIPFVFLVVAKGIQLIYASKYKLVLFVCLAIMPIAAWLRINQRWNTTEPGFNPDYLNYSNYIQTKIPANDTCIIDFDESKFISLYYLKRYGYSLPNNQLNEQTLTELYNKGAKYLVTENLSLNLNLYPSYNFKPLFKNNLCVYFISKK